jgi:hypothetical protein
MRQLLRTISAAVVAPLVGALLGVGVATGADGLLPVALGRTLVFSVNRDGAVTRCTDDKGQQVHVPYHIRIRQ